MTKRFMSAVTALAAAALLSACQSASPPAASAPAAEPDHAEVDALARANFRQVPCGQAIENKELFDAVMIWVDVYAHGRVGRTLTSQQELVGHKDAFIRACERNRNATVQSVVQAMNRPVVRRAAAPAAAPPAGAPAAAPTAPAGATPARPAAPAR